MSGVAAFTRTLLLGAAIGSGWLIGLGLRAGNDIREVPVPRTPAVEEGLRDAGIRLSGGGSRVPVLRIFGDYECPACRRLEIETGDSLRSLARAGLLEIVYLHAPLPTHWRGRLAAAAAHCGARFNRAGSVHAALQRAAREWSVAADPAAVLVSVSAAAGVARDSMAACIVRAETRAAVRNDRRLADAVGIRAVPVVMLDGAMIEYGSYRALLRHVTHRVTGRSHRLPR